MLAAEETNDNWAQIFSALSRRRFYDLLSLEGKESLLYVLPCLCRMVLYPTALEAVLSDDVRNKLRALLLGFPRTNTLVTFMSVDFSVLESDLRKEMKVRKKTMHASTNGNLDGLLSMFPLAGGGHRFESGDPAEKFRLLLSEIMTMQLLLKEAKIKMQNLTTTTTKSRTGPNFAAVNGLRKFEPLDNEAYLGDCCDLLVIFFAERPELISIEDLCELLVHYRNGPDVIRAIVMNFPDAWFRVCCNLIDNAEMGYAGEERWLSSQKRIEALNALCNLDKFAATDLINYAVEKRKLRLSISLGVRFLPPDFVAPLVQSSVAAVEDQQRAAIITFVQSAQKDWPILRDLNLSKTAKRSIAPKVDSLRTSASVQERVQYTEADETILDIIGQDSDTIIDLKRIRELWEQVGDSQELVEVRTNRSKAIGISPDDLAKALREASREPSTAILALRRVLRTNRGVQAEFIDALVETLPALLDKEVPLHVIQLASTLWSKIEPVSPRKLYVLSVAAFLPWAQSRRTRTPWRRRTSHHDLCKDPLTILRCDERVFRCAPLLSLLLRVLRCYLAASRVFLQRELNVVTTAASVTRRSVGAAPNPPLPDAEKEELMRSLIGAQESAAIQILLEACLPQPSESNETSNLTSLREIRCIICSFIHQMFIADPILSKLVHFQTYPAELLPVTVAGIPSMHICLDFIPELLAQPIQSKRVFGIDLLSCLCEHFAIPKAFSMARLAVNVLSTLIGVIPSEEVVSVFSGLIPALVRLSRVFPPLSSDISSLLVQVSRICQSRLAANDYMASMFTGERPWPSLRIFRSNAREATLLYDIHDALQSSFLDTDMTA